MWTPRPDLAFRWYALLAWLTMDAPYVEQTTDERGRPRVRLHDADGRIWTVWDAFFRDYRFHRVPHGDLRATSRVFVSADGTVRSCRFGPQADRSLAADVVAVQLRGAEYVARDSFVPPIDPRGGTLR